MENEIVKAVLERGAPLEDRMESDCGSDSYSDDEDSGVQQPPAPAVAENEKKDTPSEPKYYWVTEPVKSEDGKWVWERRVLMFRLYSDRMNLLTLLRQAGSGWSDECFFPECLLHQLLRTSTRIDFNTLDPELAAIFTALKECREERTKQAHRLLTESGGYFCVDLFEYLPAGTKIGCKGTSDRDIQAGSLRAVYYSTSWFSGNHAILGYERRSIYDKGINKQNERITVPDFWRALSKGNNRVTLISPELKEKLMERGRKLREALSSIAYMNCAGNLTVENFLGSEDVKCEHTRVVADISGFVTWNPNDGRYKWRDNGECIPYDNNSGSSDDWMLPPKIPAFSLYAKKWGRIYVADLYPITFRDDAIDKLIIKAEDKKVIKSLVGGTIELGVKRPIADIVDKGTGRVFLLHGPPGTGKTATCEAVAEYYRRPLYYATAGELGCNTQELDERLSRILDTVARWNGVILIDEADIFLLDRQHSVDLVRNAMVCIFLRLLEYFNGVLFLTSNHVSQLDLAIQSRLSCKIEYPPVDVRAVWKSLLAHFKVTSLSEAAFEYLVSQNRDANGRNIKNAIQNALLLAGFESEDKENPSPPTLDHFMTAMKYVAFPTTLNDPMAVVP